MECIVQIMFNVCGYLLFFVLLIGLPLAIFRKTRKFSGGSFVTIGTIYVIPLWLISFLIALENSIILLIIGVLLFGVGVIPIAIIILFVKGRWEEAVTLLLTIGLALVCRAFGFWLVKKS